MYNLPQLPVALPTSPLPEELDLGALAATFNPILNALNESHLTKDAIWRDMFALTGTLRTFYSPASISSAWTATSEIAKPKPFTIEPNGHAVRIGDVSWVDLPFSFETDGTPRTFCSGFLSVVPSDDGWKIWCLRTILEGLKGVADVDSLKPVNERAEDEKEDAVKGSNGVNGANNCSDHNGVPIADHVDGQNGINEANGIISSKADFDCVVIGGGQSGLSAGGRLQALDISYVILDRHPEVGDSWRSRYTSVRCKLQNIPAF